MFLRKPTKRTPQPFGVHVTQPPSPTCSNMGYGQNPIYIYTVDSKNVGIWIWVIWAGLPSFPSFGVGGYSNFLAATHLLYRYGSFKKKNGVRFWSPDMRDPVALGPSWVRLVLLNSSGEAFVPYDPVYGKLNLPETTGPFRAVGLQSPQNAAQSRRQGSANTPTGKTGRLHF